MPRDLSGCGRYPPTPKYPPFSFYTCVRVGDPEQLAKIMETDTYFITQDNGGGAPVHFAATYKQLDMLHHLLNNGAVINQRDSKGLTPLHRAAFLAANEGYEEIYEYLLSRGADPELESDVVDPYLDPVRKRPHEMCNDEVVREHLVKLNEKYRTVAKSPESHPDIGCWWTLYDYGLEVVKTWNKDYKHPYPEVKLRERMKKERRQQREARRKRREEGNFLKNGAAKSAQLDSSVAFLFPGQGSQAVGMLSQSKDIPSVKKMLETANKVLGYDLLNLCLEGPKSALDDTVRCQPALFVASLAAVEKLSTEDPDLIQKCSAAAGLSLGEYTALVFAGALSFEDGLKVNNNKAESMAEAAKSGKPHGMLSIVGLPDSEVLEICTEVTNGDKKNTNFICQPANYLFPQGRVLSGHLEALEIAQKLAITKGALKAQKVAVSGAFHTPLMNPAKAKLLEVLSEVKFQNPRIPVYSNVTADVFEDGSEIPEMLGRQLVQPVKWEQTLKKLIENGKTKLHELGPGQQIKAMVKRLDAAVWKDFKNIQP
eukprot:g6896.t1